MKKIAFPLFVSFFLGLLFFPVGPSFAGISCDPLPADVEFCLRSPTNDKLDVAVTVSLKWDYGVLPSVDEFTLKIRPEGTTYVDFNVPVSEYCAGDECSVAANKFSNLLTLEQTRETYIWEVVAKDISDADVGNSQEWRFTTEQDSGDDFDLPGGVIPPGPKPGSGIPPDLNPISSTTLPQLLETVLTFLFGISIVVLPIIIVYGGFLLLTAGGDPTKISSARTILLWAVVAFVIILLARGLPTVLRNLL